MQEVKRPKRKAAQKITDYLKWIEDEQSSIINTSPKSSSSKRYQIKLKEEKEQEAHPEETDSPQKGSRNLRSKVKDKDSLSHRVEDRISCKAKEGNRNKIRASKVPEKVDIKSKSKTGSEPKLESTDEVKLETNAGTNPVESPRKSSAKEKLVESPRKTRRTRLSMEKSSISTAHVAQNEEEYTIMDSPRKTRQTRSSTDSFYGFKDKQRQTEKVNEPRMNECPRNTRQTRLSADRPAKSNDREPHIEKSPERTSNDNQPSTRRTRSSLEKSSHARDIKNQLSNIENRTNARRSPASKSPVKGKKRKSLIDDVPNMNDLDFKSPGEIQPPIGSKRQTRSRSRSGSKSMEKSINTSLACSLDQNTEGHLVDTDETSFQKSDGKRKGSNSKESEEKTTALSLVQEYKSSDSEIDDIRQPSPRKTRKKSRSNLMEKGEKREVSVFKIGKCKDPLETQELSENKDCSSDQTGVDKDFPKNQNIIEKGILNGQIAGNENAHDDQINVIEDSNNYQSGENNDNHKEQHGLNKNTDDKIMVNKDEDSSRIDVNKDSNNSKSSATREFHNDNNFQTGVISDALNSIKEYHCDSESIGENNDRMDATKNIQDNPINVNHTSSHDLSDVTTVSKLDNKYVDDGQIPEASTGTGDTNKISDLERNTTKNTDTTALKFSQQSGFINQHSELIEKQDTGFENNPANQVHKPEEPICDKSVTNPSPAVTMNEFPNNGREKQMNPDWSTGNTGMQELPAGFIPCNSMENYTMSRFQAGSMNTHNEHQDSGVYGRNETLSETREESRHQLGDQAGKLDPQIETEPQPVQTSYNSMPQNHADPSLEGIPYQPHQLMENRIEQAPSNGHPLMANPDAMQPSSNTPSQNWDGQITGPIPGNKPSNLIGSKQLIDEVVPLLWMEGYESSYLATRDKLIMQFGSICLTTNFGNAPMQPQYVCVTMSLVAHFLIALRTITNSGEKDLDSFLVPENFQAILGAVGYTCNHNKSGEYAAGIYNANDLYDIIKKLTGLQSSTALLTREVKKGRAAKKLKTLLDEHVRSGANASMREGVVLNMTNNITEPSAGLMTTEEFPVNMTAGLEQATAALQAEGSPVSLASTVSGSGSEHDNSYRQSLLDAGDDLMATPMLDRKYINDIPSPSEVKLMSDFLQQTLMSTTPPNRKWFSWDEYKRIVMLVQARLVMYNSKTTAAIESIT